ncbi:MAG: addiction module protein [Acidobacteriota bacterium]
MSTNLVNTAKKLPLAERIELIEALWESIAEDGYEPRLTAEQASELDRRLDAHRLDPDSVVSWESIKKDLRNRPSKS